MNKISKLRHSVVKSAANNIFAEVDLEFMGSIILGALFIGVLWILAV